MNRLFLYIRRGNKKLPVAFYNQKTSSIKIRENHLRCQSFTAAGNFGEVHYEEFQTDLGFYRLIRLVLRSEVILSFSCEGATISFNFCMQGFFRYPSDNTKSYLLPKYLGKLHFAPSKHKFSYFAGPTANQEFMLINISASLQQWQDHGLTGRMKTHFKNIFKNQNAANLTTSAFTSGIDLQKWILSALQELTKDQADSIQLNSLLPLILLKATTLANEQLLQNPVENSWNQEEYTASLLAENMIMDMAEPWSIQKLADAAKLSQARIKKIFKKYIGMPTMAFKISVRMEKAKQLLIHTSLMIREISVRVGYSDPAYFSLLFKRKMGYSPSTLRKRITRQNRSEQLL